VKFSISPTWADKLPLESEKARYIGDEIAAVAAVDEDTAQEALDLIQVDFEELPGVYDPVEAMKPGAPLIHDSVENNISKAIHMECGNIEEGFASGDLILEDTFSTQAQSHCSLETHCCVAICEPNDEIKIWVNTQAPHALRQKLSYALNIDASKIHVITPYLGGGFGSKIDLEPAQAICILLSKKSGSAAKSIWSPHKRYVFSYQRRVEGLSAYQTREKISLYRPGLDTRRLVN